MEIKEVSIEFIGKVIEYRKPKGLFLTKDGEFYIAIDNRTRDAWTEEFKNKKVAIKWLLDDIDTDEAYELDKFI